MPQKTTYVKLNCVVGLTHSRKPWLVSRAAGPRGRFHSGLLENLVVWADVSEDEQILMDFECEPEGLARTDLPDVARPLHFLDPQARMPHIAGQQVMAFAARAASLASRLM
jgi:hypothetical protein